MQNNWIKEAIIYEIYPRVFSEEGNFQGIINRLQDIKDLGVNTLWLMPIHKIGMKKRKGTLGSPYAVYDHFSIHPDLGDENDFKKLVDETHKKDLRLIIDWVAVYTAWDHNWIGQHPDWYRKNEAGEIVSPNSDWSDVAHLNYASCELQDEMIKTMSRWIEKFDIDGLRCDTAGNIYGFKPIVFWERAIKRLRTIKPEILLLAEWEDPQFHTNAFDLTYSWALYHTLRKIKTNEKNLRDLTSLESVKIPWTEKNYQINTTIRGAGFIQELLDAQKKEFPGGALRMRFIENHDELRAQELFGKDASRAYATVIFTLDGVPLIYNGQEIGETVRPSHFEPFKINWEADPRDVLRTGDRKGGLRDFYKKLIRIRKENPVLYLGDIKKIPTDCDENVYAFEKEHRNQLAAVVINFSPSFQMLNLKFPRDGIWKDLLNDETIIKSPPVNRFNRAGNQLQLAPYASHIFLYSPDERQK